MRCTYKVLVGNLFVNCWRGLKTCQVENKEQMNWGNFDICTTQTHFWHETWWNSMNFIICPTYVKNRQKCSRFLEKIYKSKLLFEQNTFQYNQSKPPAMFIKSILVFNNHCFFQFNHTLVIKIKYKSHLQTLFYCNDVASAKRAV